MWVMLSNLSKPHQIIVYVNGLLTFAAHSLVAPRICYHIASILHVLTTYFAFFVGTEWGHYCLFRYCSMLQHLLKVFAHLCSVLNTANSQSVMFIPSCFGIMQCCICMLAQTTIQHFILAWLALVICLLLCTACTCSFVIFRMMMWDQPANCL